MEYLECCFEGGEVEEPNVCQGPEKYILLMSIAVFCDNGVATRGGAERGEDCKTVTHSISNQLGVMMSEKGNSSL
jgi:hypothetical protein